MVTQYSSKIILHLAILQIILLDQGSYAMLPDVPLREGGRGGGLGIVS